MVVLMTIKVTILPMSFIPRESCWFLKKINISLGIACVVFTFTSCLVKLKAGEQVFQELNMR